MGDYLKSKKVQHRKIVAPWQVMPRRVLLRVGIAKPRVVGTRVNPASVRTTIYACCR